jgi:hypothetical protein
MEGCMLARKSRVLIPIAYGLAVVFFGLFANKAVTATFTVVGALILGVAYVMGAFRDRS